MLVFMTEMKSVYIAVRAGSLNNAVCASSVKGYIALTKRMITYAHYTSTCLKNKDCRSVILAEKMRGNGRMFLN